MGRRKTTIISAAGFTVCTGLIEVLPGYGTWGLVPIVLLIVLRLVDGMFLGGEYTAANPLALEYAPRAHRGLYGSIINTGYPAALAVITVITIVTLKFFPAGSAGSAYAVWGWRIPFVIGFFLSAVVFLYYWKSVASGALVSHHRKLVATWAERLVWAHADGAGLGPIETDIGRLGILICGENTNPLARYALMAQGEQIHIATWPPTWPFTRGGADDDYRRWIEIRSAAHAFEAKVFSLSVAAHLDEAAIIGCAGGDGEVEKVLREAPQAVSLALDPNGKLVGDPIQGVEGILYLDVDVSRSIAPKMAHDVICGYQRFDVFDFRLNRRRQEPVGLTGQACQQLPGADARMEDDQLS